jgi:hypothetical protein
MSAEFKVTVRLALRFPQCPADGVVARASALSCGPQQGRERIDDNQTDQFLVFGHKDKNLIRHPFSTPTTEAQQRANPEVAAPLGVMTGR